MARPPADSREWVSFDDEDEERTWVFDVTFLTSNWKCIFGQGCQGVYTGPAPELEQGCCSYGAHFVDKKDARRVEKIALTLTPKEWQYHGTKKKVTQTNKDGEHTTKLVDDACIFLNRPGFATGAGCALHVAAVNRGVNPLKYKPEVCWQLPLRREDDVDDEGYVTSTIRQWDRKDWGVGGAEFHWWCTESPDAFVGHQARLPGNGGRTHGDGRPHGVRSAPGLSAAAGPPAGRARGTPPPGRAQEPFGSQLTARLAIIAISR